MTAHRMILGMRTYAVTYSDLVAQVLAWDAAREAHYVCFADVHMAVETERRAEFRSVVNRAAITAPDGVPLVIALRLLGVSNATRTCGPDLVPKLLAAAAVAGIPVGFYGGSESVLAELVQRTRIQHPRLSIAYAFSPPYRPLTAEEDAHVVSSMVASGARIVLVGLGCPKQERWMADHVDRIPAVMLGVGAAFDFISGAVPRAPAWLQNIGLEWAVRLASDPRRLWQRYLVHNPRFLTLFAKQLMRGSS
jgi:N-acetylglucosaminyldiphosphoundecaprenol N-acetyl-beta-D-mannosaminyltransferase